MKKKLIAGSLILSCLLMLAGCGGSSGGGSSQDAAPVASRTENYYAAESADFMLQRDGGYESLGELTTAVDTRKVVTTANFSVKTNDFGGVMRRLEQKIAVSGSYIQNSYSSAANEYRGAFANMTIRVPATMYGDFRAFITELDELTSSSEQGEDVTVQYYDTEARLAVLLAQAERVRAFIAESNNLDEIFRIERELVRISTEIEQLTTVRNRLDNLVAYATVYVEISENYEASIIAAAFGERVNNAMQGSVDNLIIVVQSLLLLLIWCWPLLVVVLTAFLLWRKYKKHRDDNRKEIKND